MNQQARTRGSSLNININNLEQQYIWHDCDPGFDDSVALTMLTAGQEMYRSKLIGVSTVGGNANLDWCTMNARRILHMCEHEGSRDVYPGANRPLVR
jgi:inosine-uridine nucleoside N-ribohydrolase